MTFTIYCHTCKIDGKKYVGQTKTTMEKRWERHVCDASRRGRPGGCRVFDRAIRKYGTEVVGTLEESNAAEEKWIAYFDCLAPKGYNLDSGGGVKTKHEESKRLHSETMRAVWAKRTPEQRAEITKKSTAWMASLTSEQRRELAAKAHASLPPEERSERARKGWGPNRKKAVRTAVVRLPKQSAELRKKWSLIDSEARKEIMRTVRAAPKKVVGEQFNQAVRDGWAKVPIERRREIALKRQANTTPEQRLERARKAWETRRNRHGESGSAKT